MGHESGSPPVPLVEEFPSAVLKPPQKQEKDKPKRREAKNKIETRFFSDVFLREFARFLFMCCFT